MSLEERSHRHWKLKARWYWPGGGPLQRDPTLYVVGRNNIGAKKLYDFDYREIDLGDSIILPGLVNSHTHLELSGCACEEPPASFVDWILGMPRRVGHGTDQPTDERFAAATRAGIEQSLRFGVTTVGDISQQMHVTRPILRESPIRAISYGEVIGLGKRRSRFEELFPRATDESLWTSRLRIGLTPHAPYTVEPDAIRRCVAHCREWGRPLAIHLAETPEEEQFIRTHSGPLKEMWERVGSWEDFAGRFDGTPVAYARSLGLINYPTVLAHVNYCTDDDLSMLAAGSASVAYCPRTHRYFGHPPHRWREMIEAGVNVVIGTDSCASSPDLNLVDELRLLHEIAPDFPVEKLWELITINAWHGNHNARADFTVFAASTDDPLREILETDCLPGQVWVDGQPVKATGNPASPC